MAAFLEVFGAGVDCRPLDPPGVCCICEATPDQSHTKIINTNRFFRPQQTLALAGRKYVCGDCASDLGKAIGQVNGEDHYNVLADVAERDSKLADAEKTIAAYAALDAAVKALAPAPKEAPKPKTKKTE